MTWYFIWYMIWYLIYDMVHDMIYDLIYDTIWYNIFCLNRYEVQILEVAGPLTHDSFMTISFSSRGRSSRTAPNISLFQTTCTELGQLWQNEHPSSNTAKCCLTSEIFQDQVYPTLHGHIWYIIWYMIWYDIWCDMVCNKIYD